MSLHSAQRIADTRRQGISMIRSTKVSMVAGMRMLVDVQQRNTLN